MVGWEIELDSARVFGPDDLGLPSAHPCLGNAAGATVPVPHDLGQQEGCEQSRI